MATSSAVWPACTVLGVAILGSVLYFNRPISPHAIDELKIPVPAFSLLERNGQPISNTDLAGKVWIASFVFTRCTGPCPAVTSTMARLQYELADVPDVRLVTFTVDPEHDDPDELKRYAERFGADAERWLFLTGKEKEIYALLTDGFKVGVQQNQGSARTPGNEVLHSTKLVVVDRHGQLRGYFSGVQNFELRETSEEFEANLRRLRDKVAALVAEKS